MSFLHYCESGSGRVSARTLAAPGGKVVAAKEDKSFVETDVEKIAKYVCINHYVQGRYKYFPFIILRSQASKNLAS